MKRLLKYSLIALSLLIVNPAIAQETEMADTMRSDGKIYVVVAIVLIVLTGLIGYLFVLDRKLSKLEKLQGKNSQ
jgi:CcmD family protein